MGNSSRPRFKFLRDVCFRIKCIFIRRRVEVVYCLEFPPPGEIASYDVPGKHQKYSKEPQRRVRQLYGSVQRSVHEELTDPSGELTAVYRDRHTDPSVPQPIQYGTTISDRTSETNLVTLHQLQSENFFPIQGISSGYGNLVDTSVIPHPTLSTLEACQHPLAVHNQHHQTSETDCAIPVDDYDNAPPYSNFTDARQVSSQFTCPNHPCATMRVDQVEDMDGPQDTGPVPTRWKKFSRKTIQYFTYLVTHFGLTESERGRRPTIANSVENCSTSCRSSGQNGASVCAIRGEEDSPNISGIMKRNGNWVVERRLSGTPDRVWLKCASLKEAQLTYDACLHHCNDKEFKEYKFEESPGLLGESLYKKIVKLDKRQRCDLVKKIARKYAKDHASTNIR